MPNWFPRFLILIHLGTRFTECKFVNVAYLLFRGNIPCKVQHVSALLLCGASRLVNHKKCYGIVIHSSDIQLNCFVKCGIYHIGLDFYLGWEVVWKGNMQRKGMKINQLIIQPLTNYVKWNLNQVYTAQQVKAVFFPSVDILTCIEANSI